MHIAIMEEASMVRALAVGLDLCGHTMQAFPSVLPCVNACINAAKFDLLITEIRLPWSSVDGLDAIRLIQLSRPAFPALILSVYDQSQIARMCGDLMNISVLTKPFDYAQLCAKLAAISPEPEKEESYSTHH